MARRRMIDPNIWESEDFSSLSMMERLLWVGMFSLADDEGRGRASASYLNIKVFPYDRLDDEEIEKGINHIKDVMSVTLYRNGDKRYYQMDHWDEWQSISHPTPSKIPSPLHEDSRVAPEYSRVSPEDSRVSLEDSILSQVNIKENKIKEYKSSQVNSDSTPTMNEVIQYGSEHGIKSKVCEKFWKYNNDRGWIMRGEPMAHWQNVLEKWNENEKKLSTSNYEQHDTSEIKVHFANLEDDDDAEI